MKKKKSWIDLVFVAYDLSPIHWSWDCLILQCQEKDLHLWTLCFYYTLFGIAKPKRQAQLSPSVFDTDSGKSIIPGLYCSNTRELFIYCFWYIAIHLLYTIYIYCFVLWMFIIFFNTILYRAMIHRHFNNIITYLTLFFYFSLIVSSYYLSHLSLFFLLYLYFSEYIYPLECPPNIILLLSTSLPNLVTVLI